MTVDRAPQGPATPLPTPQGGGKGFAAKVAQGQDPRGVPAHLTAGAQSRQGGVDMLLVSLLGQPPP